MQTAFKKQRGVELSGLMMWSVFLIIIALLGMKLIPVYINNAQIKQVFNAVVSDPDMQDASVQVIRQSYVKRASVESVSHIDASDVQIDREGNKLTLSAGYEVVVPLVANISLLLEFNPSSD